MEHRETFSPWCKELEEEHLKDCVQSQSKVYNDRQYNPPAPQVGLFHADADGLHLVVEFRFGRCQLFRQILVLTFHQLHLGMDVNDSLFVHLPCSGFLSQLPGQELRFFLPLSELLFQLAGHISKGLPELRTMSPGDLSMMG